MICRKRVGQRVIDSAVNDKGNKELFSSLKNMFMCRL